MVTYQTGLDHDPDNQELKDGMMRCMEAINRLAHGGGTEEELKERQAKAMADPEVQNILMDPIMRQASAAQAWGACPGSQCGIEMAVQPLMQAGIVMSTLNEA